MSWLSGMMRGKRPVLKVDMRLDFKPQSIEIANGVITKVYNQDSVQVEITWSTTSMFGIGMRYDVDMTSDNWHVIREDAW